MVKINTSGSPELQAVMDAIEGKTVDSEEEYREFVTQNDPPNGYVWTRSPFTGEGKWKISLTQESTAKITDTDLEQQLRSLLKDWGYWKYFEHDYRLSDGKQIDFADRKNKVALEPGAAFWHTPDDCEGEVIDEVGEHPSEVYLPVMDSDIRKQKRLSEDRWRVLWISEEGVEKESRQVRKWLDQVYE